jgi:hypothetical protein
MRQVDNDITACQGGNMTRSSWMKSTRGMTSTIITMVCILVLGTGLEAQTTRSELDVPVPTKMKDDPEIPQMPGFPIVLEPAPVAPDASYSANQQWSLGGAVLADLDGLGDLEIVHSYSYNSPDPQQAGGRIWAWDSSGAPLPGFPVVIEGGAYYSPSVSDLDGDGDLEIVQLAAISSDELERMSIQLYVIDHQGQVLAGFPRTVGSSVFLEGATMYDLDDDGTEEIIFGSYEGLQVLSPAGGTWELDFDAPFLGVGIPSIGDVNGDGEPEIFVTGMSSMHLIKPDGSHLPGWPIDSWGWLEFGWMSAAALADLDNDLDLEVIVAGFHRGEEVDGEIEVHVYHHDGTPLTGWPVRINYTVDLFEAFCSPLVTDLEGDGELDVLIGSGSSSGHAMIYAWDSSGRSKQGFPYRSSVHDPHDTSFIFMLTAADYNGDGFMEIFADSSLGYGHTVRDDDADTYGYLLGIDANGNELPGFPLRPYGFPGQNGAVLGDVDGDGDYELASISRDVVSKVMHVNLYDLGGSLRQSDVDWLTYHAANHRGGLQKRQYRGWRYVYAGGRVGR